MPRSRNRRDGTAPAAAAHAASLAAVWRRTAGMMFETSPSEGFPAALRSSAVARWSHRDPVEGGNPFQLDDSRHEVWHAATSSARNALVRIDRQLDEAEKELQRAITLGADEMSLAHYYLGGIYWGRREYKRAADELETYLRLAPQAPDAERVRNTIKELRGK